VEELKQLQESFAELVELLELPATACPGSDPVFGLRRVRRGLHCVIRACSGTTSRSCARSFWQPNRSHPWRPPETENRS
jgi:hypothetical protein